MIYPLKNWKKFAKGYRFRVPTTYSQHHLGLDIICPIGTALLAWQDLEITNFRVGQEGGNTIQIKCPNNTLLFRLMHLKNTVKLGHYKEGEVIGFTGNTGAFTTGPHLHIDISKNGVLNIDNINNFEDPESYFDSINQPIIKQNDMIVKKQGFPGLYALVGEVAIPFAVDFPSYQHDFSNAKILELNPTEFSKLTISSLKITK